MRVAIRATGDLECRDKISGTGAAATHALSQRAACSGAAKGNGVAASGQTVVAPLASEDEFTIVILDAAGARQTL